MSVRLETTYPGTRWENTRMVDTKNYASDAEVNRCFKEMYCSPCETTSGKVARVALCAGTGALICSPGGPALAAAGAAGGAVFAFCTLL